MQNHSAAPVLEHVTVTVQDRLKGMIAGITQQYEAASFSTEMG